MLLQLQSDSSGMRHYLAGKPVRSGDEIEVMINGIWVKVQYGWSGLSENPPIGVVGLDATTVTLMPDMPMRWPNKK
jgi:hypothetical protein